MKEFLSREGVPFDARNVEEDAGAYDELIARGFRSVPVTIVGATAIRGFDADAIRRALSGRPPAGG